MFEHMTHDTEFIIHRFNSKEFDEKGFFAQPVGLGRTSWKGNVLLNSGIQLLWDLAYGDNIDSASFFDNAHAHIGIGTSTLAAASTQSGLECTLASKWWQSMEVGYPSRTSETIWFRGIVGSDDGNYSWAEFTVLNGLSDAVATNLNRAVSDQGGKGSWADLDN